MTKPMEREIIRSLAYNLSAEQIAEAMDVTPNDVYFVAETRKLDIIEERVFCNSKGEF